MKVFILMTDSGGYDGGLDVHGVFSSPDKARDFFPYVDTECNEEDIVEYEVDVDGQGEKREKLFYHYAYLEPMNGETCHFGTCWVFPSENTHLRFDCNTTPKDGNSFLTCGAFARTHEEARAKAEAGLKLLNPVWQVGKYKNSDGFCACLRPRPEDAFPSWEKPYGLHRDLNQARIAIEEFLVTGKVQEGLIQ